MDFWYNLCKGILQIYRAVFVKSIQIKGGEIFHRGPKIIVANHPNASDGFVLPFIVPEKIHFLIQADLFQVPIIGSLLKRADQIPVVRGKGSLALESALEKLKLGKSIAIFPEGRLNYGKKFHRAGSGAAVLAFQSGAPVIPIGLYVPQENTKLIQRNLHNRKTTGCWQQSGNCYVHIGSPIYACQSPKTNLDYKELRIFMQNVMGRIQALVHAAQEEAH